MKINKRIEIVSSTKKGFSSMGRQPRETVRAVLAKHYTSVEITIVNNLADLETLVGRRPDVVFLGMKMLLADQGYAQNGTSKIWLAEYLDKHGIAYTGSNHLAHQLEINKSLAKQRALDCGLKTSPFYVAVKNKHARLGKLSLNYPLFVKPTNRCGSQGIDSLSVAYNFAQLKTKVRLLAVDLHADSLIEEYLPGREFSVAILTDETSGEVSALPIELIAPVDNRGARLLSAAIKQADTERAMGVTDEATNNKVSNLAINVFHALGARDYGRIDIRLDQFGTPHFLEANLMPSLKRNDGNYFPKACALNLNLSYEQMILRIARLGLARSHKTEKIMVQPVATRQFNHLEPAL